MKVCVIHKVVMPEEDKPIRIETRAKINKTYSWDLIRSWDFVRKSR